jgi:predicted O-methyltransferase YrrM
MVANTINSSQITQLLDRLFAEADASESTLQSIVKSDAASLVTSKTAYRKYYGLLKNIPLPVSHETGDLLYMLTRAMGAHNVLEFGTSFGISTIYLAAALRDNGGGRVITTEFESSKAARARENLTEAGLIDLVEIREGDALETLSSGLPKTLDFVLLDGAKALYRDILQRVEGCLRPGSFVLADDARFCKEFIQQMRSDTNRYLSVPLADDLEISMRLS